MDLQAMTPQEKRNLAANQCVNMDDFAKASKVTTAIARRMAYALSAAIGDAEIDSLAVFYDEEDGEVEVIADNGLRRLSVTYDAATELFKIWQQELRQRTEVTPLASELGDLSGYAAWLLGVANA